MKKGLRLTHGRVARNRGITLIELMIVVVIVGILAAFAYPSFQDQVRKTRRADGKAALLQTAQQLERCYTRFGRYDTCGIGAAELSEEEFYEVSTVALGASNFTLQAVPQGDQVNDAECGTLTLTNTGAEGADGDPDACW